jgi:PAS domain S-box-containing protein
MTDHSRSPQIVPIPFALEQGLRLIGASPAPMFIVRGGGVMVAPNAAFTALLEGDRTAAPDAWTPLAALLPGAVDPVLRILDGSLAQAGAELDLPTRIGLALSPLCEPDGAIVGVLGVATALPPQVDQAARELGRLVELSPVGVVRYTVDGEILDCNDAFLSMLGLSQEDRRRGLSWRALTPPEWRDVDDAGLARLRVHGVMPLIEKEFLHRDGRRIPVLVSAGKLLADGRQGFGVVIDISATRAAERALAESEARFRAITNAMPQMVWSTRPDGFHDYYNDQWYAFTGAPPGTTDGEGWNGMFHPDDQDAAWARWRHSLDTGEPYEIEYRLRHHSGAYRWVLGRALPVHDARGAIQRWMGTCTDIHEHKLTEDALREADQRKDEFLAMLGHELRNPLAPIRSAAALLPLAKADPSRVEHIGQVIARQVTHMTGLIDDLLDVSRVTRGLIALVQEDVPARLLVDEAVEQARPLIEARAHALSVSDHAGGACIHGDRKRLVQVLANLLSNAAKYTPPGGRIAVALARVDGMVEIAVSDNGIGMAPELVDGVFELFRQGQRTPDRSQGGLGIGLALVKRLVHLHGGRVGASSPGEGQGSEVVVALPACREADAPAPA